jgi:AcrR family transcriptional regulator
MSPRSYDMSGRAAAAEQTRRRIVRAAIAVYAREGFRKASMQSIARQAEVSAATVLNHFATPDDVLEAALAVLLADLGLPEPDEIAALPEREARLRAVVRTLAEVYERSGDWYAIWIRDRDMPRLQQASATFFERAQALLRAALGRGARDRHTLAMVFALTGPANLQALRESGLTTRAAADAITEVLVAWLDARGKR